MGEGRFPHHQIGVPSVQVDLRISRRARSLCAAGGVRQQLLVDRLLVGHHGEHAPRRRPPPRPARATVKTASNPTVGATILVAPSGMTLYKLSGESAAKFICTSQSCLARLAPAEGDGGHGADRRRPRWATVMRPDGTEQVTYEGAPLYTFSVRQGARPDQRAGPQRRRHLDRREGLRRLLGLAVERHAGRTRNRAARAKAKAAPPRAAAERTPTSRPARRPMLRTTPAAALAAVALCAAAAGCGAPPRRRAGQRRGRAAALLRRPRSSRSGSAVNRLLEGADPILAARRAAAGSAPPEAGRRMDRLERRFAAYAVAIGSLRPRARRGSPR